MKAKKITSILLASTLLLSGTLIGCSNSNTPNDTSTGSGSTQDSKDDTKDEEGGSTESAKKIILFQSKVEITDQLEELAAEYEEETGVSIEVWNTTGDDYFQQLKTKLANNQGPTVFSLAPGAEVEQMKSYVEDLSDLTIADKITDGMASELDGKVVGVPYTVEGFGMVYNKDLIDPAKVTNADEFSKMLDEQKENGVNGFGLSQESYFLIGHILNTPFALQKDPKDFLDKLNKGEVKMADTPEFQEFAKMYGEIRDKSYNPLEVNYDKEIGDFATGKTASIHQGNWANGMFTDYDLDFEMSMMPFPLSGNTKLAVSVPTAWFVNSQASDAEKQAGKDFLDWLYTSETGIRYLMEAFKFIPVVEGMESKDIDPLSKAVYDYTEAGNTITWVTGDWPAGIVDVYLKPVAEKFFTSDMTPEQFLTELDAAWAEANK